MCVLKICYMIFSIDAYFVDSLLLLSLVIGADSQNMPSFKFELTDVIVDTLSLDTSGYQGEFLIVKELPECFYQQYGKIPEKIFVRECYHKLYEIAAESILNSESGKYSATVFRGIPGIGKSLFLIYFIYRFLHDDRFTDKRFALEFGGFYYHYFQPTSVKGELRDSILEANRSLSADFLLLCDINEPNGPLYRVKWTFIFTSPEPVRYKNILKNSPQFMYTMPAWSQRELMCINNDTKSWYEYFVLFGGVPRYVSAVSNEILLFNSFNTTLEEQGENIAKNFPGSSIYLN